MDALVTLATACYVGIAVVGLATRDDRAWYLGLTAVAFMAWLSCLTRYQAGFGLQWALASYLPAGFAAVWWKRFHGDDHWPRRERRAMAQLFGVQTVWQMLINDPRLKTWRQPK